MVKYTGRCLCGTVNFEGQGEPLWTSHCQCESCRRCCSAPITSFLGFSAEKVSWVGERKFYQSSEIAVRGFCLNCGTQMSFESTKWPDEIHLYAASLDDPSLYKPQMHSHWDERLSWSAWQDDLPKHKGSADV